jgi:hypothetical protein
MHSDYLIFNYILKLYFLKLEKQSREVIGPCWATSTHRGVT